MAEIHVGDVGTIFQITILDETGVVDVSNADAMYVYLQRPDGSVITVTPVFVNSGTDGLIKYVTQSGDLSMMGTWQIQAQIDFGTDVFNTDIQKFKVYRNLR